MRQDLNEKENKIWDFNHRVEILPEVFELKLNDINSQITSIHSYLNNITSFDKGNAGNFQQVIAGWVTSKSQK